MVKYKIPDYRQAVLVKEVKPWLQKILIMRPRSSAAKAAECSLQANVVLTGSLQAKQALHELGKE